MEEPDFLAAAEPPSSTPQLIVPRSRREFRCGADTCNNMTGDNPQKLPHADLDNEGLITCARALIVLSPYLGSM
jgi:hypothetical protein